VRKDQGSCEHCGTRLATVSCPACFAMVFRGAKFCSQCGAGLQRNAGAKTKLPCPRCKVEELAVVHLGATEVHECGKCHGLWVESATFEELCVDRERQSAALGRASAAFVPGQRSFESKVRYAPCPVCNQLMHRLNFAKCSGVIVDSCKPHGTWFDRDELQHIVEFLRRGGMEVARQKEIAELEAARRRLELARSQSALERRPYECSAREHLLFEIAGSLIESALD
jgi:Zn-finger nucleic acid-binding protein